MNFVDMNEWNSDEDIINLQYNEEYNSTKK